MPDDTLYVVNTCVHSSGHYLCSACARDAAIRELMQRADYVEALERTHGADSGLMPEAIAGLRVALEEVRGSYGS